MVKSLEPGPNDKYFTRERELQQESLHCSRLREDICMDMHHQISTWSIFHYKTHMFLTMEGTQTKITTTCNLFNRQTDRQNYLNYSSKDGGPKGMNSMTILRKQTEDMQPW